MFWSGCLLRVRWFSRSQLWLCQFLNMGCVLSNMVFVVAGGDLVVVNGFYVIKVVNVAFDRR